MVCDARFLPHRTSSSQALARIELPGVSKESGPAILDVFRCGSVHNAVYVLAPGAFDGEHHRCVCANTFVSKHFQQPVRTVSSVLPDQHCSRSVFQTDEMAQEPGLPGNPPAGHARRTCFWTEHVKARGDYF